MTRRERAVFALRNPAMQDTWNLPQEALEGIVDAVLTAVEEPEGDSRGYR